MKTQTTKSGPLTVDVHTAHTVVLGSGAAGLNAAFQLHVKGVEDVVIVTEGLDMGTSINTGSDKQTYYKLGMYGAENDSPRAMAEAFFEGGGTHGDISLVEAATSVRAFMNLINIGVRFPTDRYGQFIGYKTDHDPRRRATSIGPYTSRDMCVGLIREVKRRGIQIQEGRVAVSLLTTSSSTGGKRASGVVVMRSDVDAPTAAFEVYLAENVVFAVGGPGGLYKESVYPECHTGAIGLALLAGAKARNLPESQFGIASTKFRWNVSGTYMQVVPRFYSTEPDGSDQKEFLRPYFETVGRMCDTIFLKGYQWPFDTRKVADGSSLIDLIVYTETHLKGRRVYLDFTRDCEGYSFEALGTETSTYLKKSFAAMAKPIQRLKTMNPQAIELYKSHGIDLATEPLEIAVCAQHNNGGLAANVWWESENISHLFPVGEVNGSHGVCRPGGAALNAGQVGGVRAADFIANRYAGLELHLVNAEKDALRNVTELWRWLEKGKNAAKSWEDELEEMQRRMSKSCAHVRSKDLLTTAKAESGRQWRRLAESSCGWEDAAGAIEALRVRHLCFAHLAYIDAVLFAVGSGVGSRGSGLVLDANGKLVHSMLPTHWRHAPENVAFRSKVHESVADLEGNVVNAWVDRRPIPVVDAWFENDWRAYNNGEIFNPEK